MMSYYMENNILLDASFLIALVFYQDTHYQQATMLFNNALRDKPIFITNNYLFSEAMTMTLIRSKQIKYCNALKEQTFNGINTIFKMYYIDNLFNEEIDRLFLNQQKYKSEFLSFSDCSLIVQARKQKIKTIFTFDSTFKQFHREFRIMGV